MNQSRRTFVKSVATVTAAVTAAGAAIDSQGATVKASKKLSSASAMAIAADGKLIIADWRASALVALSLPALPTAKERSFNILNVTTVLFIVLTYRIKYKPFAWLLSGICMVAIGVFCTMLYTICPRALYTCTTPCSALALLLCRLILPLVGLG